MRTKLKYNEKLLLVINKHYIVFLKPVLMFVAAIYVQTTMAGDAGGTMGKLYASIGKYFMYVYAALICYIAYVFLDRQKNIWVVTDMRFIDEWGIITYKSKESPLDKINNVDVAQDPLGRVLGYGNVLIQTAATQGETVIKQVEKPILLRETILSSAEAYRTMGTAKQHIGLRDEADAAADTRECPFCYETIKKKAIICRFCGRDIVPDTNDEQPVQIQTEDMSATQGQLASVVGDSVAAPISADFADGNVETYDTADKHHDKNTSTKLCKSNKKKESPTAAIEAVLKNALPINTDYDSPHSWKAKRDSVSQNSL